MKPTELDLNLDGMRAEALRKMIGAIRTALQECDDIEAMARVLHSQAATDIKASVRRNTNGNGHDPHRLLPGRKQRSIPVHIDRSSLLAAALVLIDKAGPEGINSKQIESYLRANGAIPAAISLQGARVAINDVLRPLPAQNRIRRQRILGVNGSIVYWPGTNTAPPKIDETPLDGSGHNGRTERLREFLISALIEDSQPQTASHLRHLAMSRAGFDAKWGKGDTLQNQVGRLLREMVVDGKAKRIGNGRHGRGGIPFTYTIVRPKVSVSRAAAATV